MAIEIERKFLVLNDDWRSGVKKNRRIEQGYIAVNERCAVRVRVADGDAWLNVKSSGLDIARNEFEYSISLDDAEEMLLKFCAGCSVVKTRYYIPHGDHTWEVDVFDEQNKGLVLAEIELQSETEAFNLPSWVGREVSGDARYLNSNLAVKPYRTWRTG